MVRKAIEFPVRCGGQRLSREKWSARVCGMLLGAVVAVMWVAQSESDEKAPVDFHVADIRFEIIEPPVVAQRDITVRAATSNQQPEKKPFECSGMVWLDGRLVLTSDRHEHVLFICPVDLDKMTIGRPAPHVIIRNEQELLKDAESITIRRSRGGKPVVYVMCSLSNDRDAMALPKRCHMLRCSIDRLDPLVIGRPTVVDAAPVRAVVNEHFKDIKVNPYRTYFAGFVGADKNTYRWGNVEGIALTPDGSTLLCGMRNPLLGGKALAFALRGVDEAFDAGDAARTKLIDLFTLDLGGRGISDICWDPVTKGYLLAAGKSNGPKLDKDQPFPPNTLDCALFWWSGRKSETPICFARVPSMKIEAICRLGSSRFIAICSDEGDVSEGRAARQSVLTILDFRGILRRGEGG
jgi:hypothetical protein